MIYFTIPKYLNTIINIYNIGKMAMMKDSQPES